MKKFFWIFASIMLVTGFSINNIGQGKRDTGVEKILQGSNILLVVGDENGKSEPGKGIGDLFIRNRLEKVLGYNVLLGIDSAPANDLFIDASRADVVIVSESATSKKLQDKLRSVKTPIFNYEAFIQDDMGLTAKEPSGDPGEPGEFAYGVRDKDTGIEIVLSDHPLAAGFEGIVKVYTEPKQVTWGKVGKGAKVIATLAGDDSGAVIYVYEKGAALFDGTEAAGMRIGFFLEDDDTTGTANLMTEDGLRLFDTAIQYALTRD